MAADIEMADESYSAELDVVGDSRLVQPTNAYGSPLAGALSQRKEMPEEETMSSVAILNRVNANLKCCENCKCGTKKAACKNKGVVVVVNRNPSAFARHQEQQANAEREIKEFIQQLASPDKDKILLRLLSQGRGSLEFARDLLDDDNDSDPPDPRPQEEIPEWCTCTVCRVMPLEEENVCCGKRTCVTSFKMYENICLDREVLVLAIRARFDIRAEEPDYSSNSFRKAAYRQYCLWKYGKLGKGNRRVLPSCVVLTTRRYYPAPDGVYMGYRRS
ncbi:PREDICTED: P2X purinoceptor 7-like [Acropora digitifera]|uniref:P2X purinoceptor 7-like n=1 Tax=Acropora digitifera TaxID=70779 RepID=UPI00077A3332|nr:PREDICTED: P2X purinoceptor 7-like [Acropora digitifera]